MLPSTIPFALSPPSSSHFVLHRPTSKERRTGSSFLSASEETPDKFYDGMDWKDIFSYGKNDARNAKVDENFTSQWGDGCAINKETNFWKRFGELWRKILS
jgi:hypothetical protein